MRRDSSKWAKRGVAALGGALLLAALCLLAANLWVLGQTRGRIEQELAQCVAEPVGIVFGTTHWSRSGERNPHFEARMNAAARLIGLGRVKHLLLSGDNRTRYYNEPVTMWRDLRARDVRELDMTLDYAGFSTFDTLARSKEVFGVDRALLITQAWHLPRALFIADALGIEVRGCAVPTEPVDGVWRLKVREWLARAATLGDLYLWGREPYFLGPFEPLEIVPPAEELSAPSSAADRVRESATGSPSSSAR